MRPWKLSILTAGAAFALGGCASAPHNNVLLFGTDTKIALDVSTAATSGGAPQITLGYKRAEAVWMPLVANKVSCEGSTNCRTETALENGQPALLAGKRESADQTTLHDAYSVFASLGAEFDGEASTQGVQSGGGIAQFFATGIAAQNLALNPNIQQALAVESPEAAEGRAIVAEENKKASAAAFALPPLSNEEKKDLAIRMERETLEARAETNALFDACGNPGTDAAKWNAMIAKAVAAKTLRKRWADRLTHSEMNTVSAIRAALEDKRSSGAREVLVANKTELCSAPATTAASSDTTTTTTRPNIDGTTVTSLPDGTGG